MAAVDLGGQASPNPAQSERLFAQVAWTLRQEPTISAVSIAVGGQTLRAPSGGTEYPLDDAVRYDPTGFGAPTRIYGLAGGRLGVADGTELQPLGGPLSTRRFPLQHVTVDLTGERAAATTTTGRLVLAATDGRRASRCSPRGSRPRCGPRGTPPGGCGWSTGPPTGRW